MIREKAIFLPGKPKALATQEQAELKSKDTTMAVTCGEAEAIREAACVMDEARASLRHIVTQLGRREAISSRKMRVAADDAEALLPLILQLHHVADRLLGPLPD